MVVESYGLSGALPSQLSSRDLQPLPLFTFINTWNDYFMQLVMLTSRQNLTISLGVATMQAEMATNYGLIMAGAALAAVPIVTVFLVFQKFLHSRDYHGSGQRISRLLG